MTPSHHLDQVRQLAELQGKVTDIAADVTNIVTKMDMIFELQLEQARLREQMIEGRDTMKRAFERLETQERAAGVLKEQTERWINRGVGAWFVGALLVGVIQMLILDRVKSYEGTQAANTHTLVTVDRRLAWIEYEMKKSVAAETMR